MSQEKITLGMSSDVAEEAKNFNNPAAIEREEIKQEERVLQFTETMPPNHVQEVRNDPEICVREAEEALHFVDVHDEAQQSIVQRNDEGMTASLVEGDKYHGSELVTESSSSVNLQPASPANSALHFAILGILIAAAIHLSVMGFTNYRSAALTSESNHLTYLVAKVNHLLAEHVDFSSTEANLEIWRVPTPQPARVADLEAESENMVNVIAYPVYGAADPSADQGIQPRRLADLAAEAVRRLGEQAQYNQDESDEGYVSADSN